MSESLDTLSSNLKKEDKKQTVNYWKNKNFTDEQIDLLLKKGVFPYDWFDDQEKLKYDSLPEKKYFYSKLNKSDISDRDYEHAKKVWKEFNCKTFEDYHDLYLITDVLLLSDVFDNFREICYKNYGLDPANYLTSPSLAWDAMLKMTKVKIELFTDVDMYLMNEKGIRGGGSNVGSIRFSEANHKYLHDYDKTKLSKYIMYEDMNNLYGFSMIQKLPLDGFKWVELNNFNVENIKNYDNENDEKGYIIECDLEYPKNLHDLHNDLPLAPENMQIEKEFLSDHHNKQIDEINKKNYVCHIRNLQYYLNKGMILTKIHRVIEFNHSKWLEPYYILILILK